MVSKQAKQFEQNLNRAKQLKLHLKLKTFKRWKEELRLSGVQKHKES